MEEIKFIAINLAKIGMMTEKIACVLETDVHMVELWLNEAEIYPGDYRDNICQRQLFIADCGSTERIRINLVVNHIIHCYNVCNDIFAAESSYMRWKDDADA